MVVRNDSTSGATNPVTRRTMLVGGTIPVSSFRSGKQSQATRSMLTTCAQLRCTGNGAESKFGDFCKASGGVHVPTWGIGGPGGKGTGSGNGVLNLHGGYGQSGNIDGHGNSEAGGNGGDSYWGGGGRGASAWGNRAPGKYGGGVSLNLIYPMNIYLASKFEYTLFCASYRYARPLRSSCWVVSLL